MALTTDQLQVLAADLTTNAATVPINGTPTPIKDVPHGADNARQVADWYNQSATPAFTVWRTDLTTDDVNNAVDWTEVVALTTNNLLCFSALKDQSRIDASRASTRAAFGAIFPAANKPNSNAGLLAAAKRAATYAEKLFATGAGTDASPAVMGYEGQLSGTDILTAWGS